jgi:hypothetical protein
MWYVEVLVKTYNEGDRAFYDAILLDHHAVSRCYLRNNLYIKTMQKERQPNYHQIQYIDITVSY